MKIPTKGIRRSIILFLLMVLYVQLDLSFEIGLALFGIWYAVSFLTRMQKNYEKNQLVEALVSCSSEQDIAIYLISYSKTLSDEDIEWAVQRALFLKQQCKYFNQQVKHMD